MCPKPVVRVTVLQALRDGAWLAASYSYGGLSMPFDAVAADEAAPVVGGVGESVGGAAGLLGEHVGVLDEPVGGLAGAVVGEDLFCPAADGAGEAGQLSDLGVAAPQVEGDYASPGVSFVGGDVDVSEEFVGDEAGRYFPIGVTRPLAATASRRTVPG
jgi:hypothetical protein